MTPLRKQTIRETWEQVRESGDAVATLFYDRLFQVDPAIEFFFLQTDMVAQRSKLLQALALLVASLERLDTLEPVLAQMGRRHAAYGVRQRHYVTVGSALLWTLERSLGEDWTEDAEQAWAEVYALVAGIMSAAEEETPLPRFAAL